MLLVPGFSRRTAWVEFRCFPRLQNVQSSLPGRLGTASVGINDVLVSFAMPPGCIPSVECIAVGHGRTDNEQDLMFKVWARGNWENYFHLTCILPIAGDDRKS